ncbi:MAG TPA: cytochrome c-type biogenesis protein CcmH [Candidatus Limnocylindria bacterium]|nr:cytochrome c-type biogenesis protein CcmH [Candidatus Limnocylindria bacterium]
MRRQLLLVAGAALLALAGLGVVATLRPAPAPGIDQVAAQVAAELRCPDCQGLSVAESRTAAATAIRAEIAELLADGASAEAVRQHFVDRYGAWILLDPPNPWAAWIPALVIALGLLIAGWWVLARRPRSSPAPRPAGAADAAVRRELEELDA